MQDAVVEVTILILQKDHLALFAMVRQQQDVVSVMVAEH